MRLAPPHRRHRFAKSSNRKAPDENRHRLRLPTTSAAPALAALIQAGYPIAAVFTHPDDPSENRFFGSVASSAPATGIPVHAPEDVNHPIWVERIRALEPDFIFSFYYRNLLSGDVLACAKRGAYNLHGSRCRAIAVVPRPTGCWSTARPRPA